MNTVRAIKLHSGDVIYIGNTNEKIKVGKPYKNYPAIVSYINYKPKKWYEFWKRKEILGFYVTWIGEQ